MIYYYLFKDMNNGHGEETYSYRPFTTQKKLTQEKSNEMILRRNAVANRTGGNISDLYTVACDEGYEMKVYRCSYKLSDRIENDSLDPLPLEYREFEIIESVMGNY